MVPCWIQFTHGGQSHTGWMVGTRQLRDARQTLQFVVACSSFVSPVFIEQSHVVTHGVLLPPTTEGQTAWTAHA